MNNEKADDRDIILRAALKVILTLTSCFVITVVAIALLPFLFDFSKALQVTEDRNLKFAFVLAALILGVSGSVIKQVFLRRNKIALIQEYIADYLKLTLLTFAVFEMIAILGLIFWLGYGDRYFALILSILSIFFMLLNWPRKSDFFNADKAL